MRERDRALGHGQDFTGEAQILEVFEKSRVVVPNLLQERDVLGAVTEAAYELQRHLESGDQQVRSTERRPPRIEVERGDRRASGPPGDVCRVRVIEVGK